VLILEICGAIISSPIATGACTNGYFCAPKKFDFAQQASILDHFYPLGPYLGQLLYFDEKGIGEFSACTNWGLAHRFGNDFHSFFCGASHQTIESQQHQTFIGGGFVWKRLSVFDVSAGSF
jgi:hypothetical protein